MKNKGYLLISLGTIFVIAAASLLFYNYSLEKDAKAAANEVVPKLIEQIKLNQDTEYKEEQEGVSQQPSHIGQEEQDAESRVITVNKQDYSGVLTIASLHLELPVLATYHYSSLKIAPCIYSGNPLGKVVIAGHNYKAHFGEISGLSIGEPISFVNVEGTIFLYQVEKVEILDANEVDEMIHSDWDFTLFTCNYVGDKRITVRCKKIES